MLNASGAVIGSATANAGGGYTIALPAPLADGTYPLSVRAVDLANNIGAASPAFSLKVQTTPPASPPAPMLSPLDNSGPGGGTLTDIRAPRLVGTAAAGSTVAIIGPTGATLASATASTSDGTYAAAIASPLADGVYMLRAVAVDFVGNASAPSAALTITIDGTPPAAPPAPGLLPSDDSGTLGDGITNVRQPRVTGTAEAGSTVQVVDASGNPYGSAVAGGDGSYTIKLTSALADGTYALRARATDAAGNSGPAGVPLTLTILTAPPAAPSAPTLLAADDSGGPGLTNIRQPRLTGFAAANGSVRIVDASGNTVASATSAADGSYVAKVASSLADGTFAFRAIATDAAGNTGPAGSAFSLRIDGTPPAAPSAPALLAADDSGKVGDGITDVRTPRLVVSAPSGLTVEILNAAGAVLGSSPASTGGTYTVAVARALADGAYPVRAVAVDSAGNVSTAAGPFSLTVMATPPTLAAPGIFAADDTGTVGDGITTVRRPRISGVGSPGGQVSWIGPDGSTLATTTASATDGSYVVQLPTASANGVIAARVREVDVAGDVGPISAPLNLTIQAEPGDYFGDGQTDVGIFRPGDDTFYLLVPRTGALYAKNWAIAGDIPVSGDFYGDGHADIAVYRPSNSTFYYCDPATGAVGSIQWGSAGSIPVPGDYDGDGKADAAIFYTPTSTFYVLDSSTNTLVARQYGASGDIPVPADYFGNGHLDYAVYRPSNGTFFIFDPITNVSKTATWGQPGDIPMPADYFGTGKANVAVVRPGTTDTYIIQQPNGAAAYVKAFGITGDIPVSGDYFGDGHADLAVYRPANSTCYALDAVTGGFRVAQWGASNTEKPIIPTITAQFKPTGTPAAISAHGGPAIVLDLIPPSPEIGLIVPTPDLARKRATAFDRALADLSLERWRVAD